MSTFDILGLEASILLLMITQHNDAYSAFFNSI